MEGKAKDTFEKWFEKEYRTFTTSYAENVDKINNHIIVEWLDSVNIYVDITPNYDVFGRYNRGYYGHVLQNGTVTDVYKDGDVFDTRQEATEAAIKKAVEIYNSKYGNPQGDPETTK